jgi:hypothetical protein
LNFAGGLGRGGESRADGYSSAIPIVQDRGEIFGNAYVVNLNKKRPAADSAAGRFVVFVIFVVDAVWV